MKSNPKRWLQWTLVLAFVAGVAQACGGAEEEPYTVAYRVDVDASTSCGNGVLESPEECDAPDFGGQTCASATMDNTPKGRLRCSDKCKLIVTGCTGSSQGPGTGGTGGTGGRGSGGAGGTSSGGAGGLMGMGGRRRGG